MSSTVFNAFIVPRKEGETELSWLLNTRKYLRSFEIIEMYKEILKREEIEKVSVDDWVKAKNINVNRDVILSLFTSAPDYAPSDIVTYLANDATKDLGLALAIQFEDFEKFYGSNVEIPDLILYLENNILNEHDINLIKDNKDIIENVFDRIVDKEKVMYHNLLNNFLNIIQNSVLQNLSSIFSKKKISAYIAHANFYDHDALLEYILTNYPDSHPNFSKLPFMFWDSFTRSRYFSRWLKTRSIMSEISRYYLELDIENDIVEINKNYMRGFLEFNDSLER